MSILIAKKRGQHIAHSLERAWERYGVRLTNEDYEQLVKQIKTGEAPEIGRRDDGVLLHLVKYHRISMLACYREPETITTFFPRP